MWKIVDVLKWYFLFIFMLEKKKTFIVQNIAVKINTYCYLCYCTLAHNRCHINLITSCRISELVKLTDKLQTFPLGFIFSSWTFCLQQFSHMFILFFIFFLFLCHQSIWMISVLFFVGSISGFTPPGCRLELISV